MAGPAVLDEVIEQRSKSLFGNRHMLRVARAIADERGPFTVLAVAKATDVPYSSVYRLARQLEDVGLLTSVSPTDGEPRRWYTREKHKFWLAAQDLCTSITSGRI